MNHCLFKAKDTKGAVGNTVDYSSLTFKPMICIRTPVKQYVHTGSSEIRTPVKRNLHTGCLRTGDH